MNYSDKLISLDEKSVWIFTKQDTDFDQAFRGVKLFASIHDKENTNIEEYFSENHDRFGVNTDRHRMLIIPQMYGLLTKTPFYERGGNYNKEAPTQIYEKMKSLAINSKEYNQIKTEQLLKFKVHAIIDTANNNEDYHILPVIYIYQVLKKLQKEYNINEISEEQLYTYVLTSKTYSELNDTVNFIATNAPTSEYVGIYKDRSRVMTFIKNNLNLFIYENQKISINPIFDAYFYENFIKKFDINDLHEQLIREVDYSYFLHNQQHFNINLINSPDGCDVCSTLERAQVVSTYVDEGGDETDYLEKVDTINESNINEDISQDAYKVEPNFGTNGTNSRRYRTNPLLGKIAIKKSYYQCQRDCDHETFISKSTNKNYMEAHHLVPVCFQKDIWDKYHINIDCVENLVSLCPNCHKAFHYGDNRTKSIIIEAMYRVCYPRFKAIRFNISVDEIKKLYGIEE